MGGLNFGSGQIYLTPIYSPDIVYMETKRVFTNSRHLCRYCIFYDLLKSERISRPQLSILI